LENIKYRFHGINSGEMRSIFFSDVNLEPFHCDDLSFLFSTHTSSPLTLSSPLPLLHNPSPHDEDGVGLEVYDMRWVVWNGFFSFVSPSPSFISSALYQSILRLYQPPYHSIISPSLDLYIFMSQLGRMSLVCIGSGWERREIAL